MSRRRPTREARNSRLPSVRCTPSLREAAERRADALGLTWSEYINRLVEVDTRGGRRKENLDAGSSPA